MKLRRRQANFLAGFGAAKADAEGPIDREHVEAEKADDGPGAHQEERNASGETHHADKGHHHQEAGAVERAVRRKPRRKQLRLAIRIKIIACGHDLLLYTNVVDLTFALVPLRSECQIQNHTGKLQFASVPLVLTFVNEPAAMGYECQTRDTRSCRKSRAP